MNNFRFEGRIYMFAKKENIYLILISVLLMIFPTPLYADAADISISVVVEPTINMISISI